MHELFQKFLKLQFFYLNKTDVSVPMPTKSGAGGNHPFLHANYPAKQGLTTETVKLPWWIQTLVIHPTKGAHIFVEKKCTSILSAHFIYLDTWQVILRVFNFDTCMANMNTLGNRSPFLSLFLLYFS
jgi:hypothetical protein